MDNYEKPEDVRANAHSQDGQDDSPRTKPDMNKDSVRPVFSSDSEVSLDILSHVSDDYQNVKNIKCEDEQEEDINCHREGDIGGVSEIICLQSVKIEEEQVQQLNEQEIIESFKYSAQSSTSINGVTKFVDVVQEKNTCVSSGNFEETRHWVVCSGNILKEVKAEYAVCKSVTECGEDRYEKQQQCRIHNTNAKEIKTNVSLIKSQESGLQYSQLELDGDAYMFTCDTCGTSSSWRGSRDVHKSSRRRVKPYRCHLCTALRESQCERNLPERILTSVKHFACSTCGKSFARVGSLNDHERIHSGVKPFTCTICGNSFTQSGSLRSHERIHSGVKPFTCTICGKSFAHAGSLRRHGGIHLDVKPFTCTLCGKSFARAINLRIHERTHSGVTPFTCTICEKSFTQARYLRDHETIHSGVKQFTCTICEKPFALARYLKIHEITHAGVKPFTCTRCGKSFTKAGNLKHHEIIHVGVKPFRPTCTVCGQSFSQMGNLRVHERLHSGVKPFTCAL